MATKKAGQIIKRGKNTWLVRVFVGRIEGKRTYRNQPVRGTKHDADAVLQDMLALASTGRLFARAKASVNEYLDGWLETIIAPNRKVRTLHDYTETLQRYVRPHVGGMVLSKVTMYEVRAMVATLTKQGLAPRTVRKAHEVLRNALEQAVTDGILPENPARTRLIPLPATVETERETVPSVKVQKFIDATNDERLGAYFLLLLCGGFRPSEALALRWSDIEGDTVTVRRVLVDKHGLPLQFETPKTKKSARQVVLPTVAVKALEEHQRRQTAEELIAGDAWQNNALVFCNEVGEPLKQDQTRDTFARLLKAAELPKMRIYDLRHSAATILLEMGEDLKVISDLLGHSTIRLTADTYTHVSKETQKRPAARWDAMLES